MEPLCDFCGVVRAAVYCKSDSARLCLNCDGCVHSANALSHRHSRCLLCDKCNSQTAIVHCMDHKLTLCQDCDWNRNECSVLGHRRLAINSYTGCPSLAELSRIWFNVFDANSSRGGGGSLGLESLGTLPKNDSCTSKCLDQHDNDGSFALVGDRLNEIKQGPYVRYEPWVGQPHIISSSPDYMSCSRDQALFFPQDSNEPKGCPDNIKDLGTSDGNGLCEGLNVDDVQLNFQNADEIFEDGGMECLLMDKHISVTESNGLIESAIEASSSVQQDCVAYQSSAVGDNSVMQPMNSNTNCALMNPGCNKNINLGFSEGQVHSSIPVQLSDIARENGATDYQDCGLPPVFLTGESPWESNLEGTSPQARDKAKSRYYEKKKNRSFGKQIRYESRKARADTRKRVKGRFVKASEEYDNDPPVAGDT
ncbi:hypothetical protein RIF29_27368 [Crotalaria pallida]|uniref:Uncharacterized protein n=1 Tax=Crotalaria pallida TaxID=3830 RepID=A0AAN9ER51_CROPI